MRFESDRIPSFPLVLPRFRSALPANTCRSLGARLPLARGRAEHSTGYWFYLTLRAFSVSVKSGKHIGIIPSGKGDEIRSIVLEPTLQERVAHYVDAVCHAHLFHRARLIHLDGFDADVEAGCDLLVCVAPCEEA